MAGSWRSAFARRLVGVMPRSELAIGGSLASIEVTDDTGGTEGAA
jgi:hypothetical protein